VEDQGSPKGCFFCGRRRLGKFLLCTILGRGKWLSLIDATCARKMESRSIIYSFIARLPMLCGATSLAGLVYLGSCLVAFQTCALVGVPLEGLGVLWFGKWCLFVSFGHFEGGETIDVSRMWKVLWKQSLPLSCTPCIYGLRLTFPLCLLAMWTFFPAFLFLVRCSFCIYPIYFWGTLRF
jgi:hypothetical protein